MTEIGFVVNKEDVVNEDYTSIKSYDFLLK